jgi:hypothetical protein
MIGPKGKISYVSLKASQSKHLSNLGFMVAPQQDAPTTKQTPRSDAGKA